MKLTAHTKWRREFFEKGDGPSKAEILEAVQCGEIPGRIIRGKPYIDVPRWLGKPNGTVQNPTTPDLLA
ncbi:MAG: hypothetical protein AAFY29_22935 [Pseudomonadota bacterium]